MKKVIVNKVRCKKCNDIIKSTDRHKFKRCKCGSIFIDGGTDYQRYGLGLDRQGITAVDADDYIDFSYSVYDE